MLSNKYRLRFTVKQQYAVDLRFKNFKFSLFGMFVKITVLEQNPLIHDWLPTYIPAQEKYRYLSNLTACRQTSNLTFFPQWKNQVVVVELDINHITIRSSYLFRKKSNALFNSNELVDCGKHFKEG